MKQLSSLSSLLAASAPSGVCMCAAADKWQPTEKSDNLLDRNAQLIASFPCCNFSNGQRILFSCLFILFILLSVLVFVNMELNTQVECKREHQLILRYWCCCVREKCISAPVISMFVCVCVGWLPFTHNKIYASVQCECTQTDTQRKKDAKLAVYQLTKQSFRQRG